MKNWKAMFLSELETYPLSISKEELDDLKNNFANWFSNSYEEYMEIWNALEEVR
jgi:hypothetical protein